MTEEVLIMGYCIDDDGEGSIIGSELPSPYLGRTIEGTHYIESEGDPHMISMTSNTPEAARPRILWEVTHYDPNVPYVRVKKTRDKTILHRFWVLNQEECRIVDESELEEDGYPYDPR